MKPSRLTVFAFLSLGVLAVWQPANSQSATAPSINGDQVRITVPGGDNWQVYVPTCATVTTPIAGYSCTIPIAAKKVHPELNGVRQYQATELAPGISPNVVVTLGTATTTVLWVSPIPGAGDVTVIEATQ